MPGLGTGLKLDAAKGNGGASMTYDTDAQAYFTAMSVQPDATRKTLINTLVLAMKAHGSWSAMDVAYLTAAHDAQAARLNIKNPVTFAASLANAPTFTTDRGYAGNGATSYLDTGFNLSTNGVQFTQNSAHIAEWCQNDLTILGGEIGTADASSGTSITPRYVDGKAYFGINSANDGAGITVADGKGFYAANRSSSSAVQSYKNGTSIGGGVSGSIAPLSNTLLIGRSALASFGSRINAFASAGAGLSAGQQTNLYNDLLAYMQGVGAS